MEQAPLVSVQLVEQFHDAGLIEPLVADPLAHMSPVFLFDVGVVVFAVGAAAGEVYGVGAVYEVAQQVVVEELGAVVGIETKQGEWQGLFDIFDLFQDVTFSFTPDGPLFGPTGGDINTVKGISEHAGEGLSAMGDGIGFEEAGTGLVPLVGLDGDVISQERAGFSGGTASFLILDTDGTQEAIDRCCRDAV